MKSIAKMTRGERVIAFIENFCVVPEGDLRGRMMKLEPFQRKFILEVYDNPHGTRLAILSIGRKNGKTPLIAALALAHIAGPEATENSQIISGAMSQEQASGVFKYIRKMVMANDALAGLVKCQPSLKRAQGLALNVEYKAISRQKKTAQGLAPKIAILDEVGQIQGPQDDFVEAIETALGAYDDAILFVISTQASSDTDLLSTWIDDYRDNRDPHTVCHVYAAENPECSVSDEDAWRQSNPALGIFRSAKDMRALAEKAQRMPSFEASFRNLNLNQRVNTNNPLIPKGVWLANSFEPSREAFRGREDVYAGLDLSARTDLTSFVLTVEDDERVQVLPFFWTPEHGLKERAERDRQPYLLWKKLGVLRTTPGATVDYDFVAAEIRDILAELGVRKVKVAFDRWRIDVFKQALARLEGIPIGSLEMVNWGQGFQDMAPAVDALEDELLNDKVAHGNHPVLTMCASNVTVVKDEAGNRKPTKAKSTGRIDGAVALMQARGLAKRDIERQPTYQMISLGS